MAYTKTQWNPGGPPGISAENLNKIEQGIADAHDKVDTALTVVGEVAEELAAHKNDNVKHITSAERTAWNSKADANIREDTSKTLKTEVVSSSESVSPEEGRIIYDSTQKKFLGGNGSEWL